MPNTGLVIASMLNRPVLYISQYGWNTCFPMFSGPDLSEETDPLVIARVGEGRGAHYICPVLDSPFPLGRNHPQWRYFRAPEAEGWITLYGHRLMD